MIIRRRVGTAGIRGLLGPATADSTGRNRRRDRRWWRLASHYTPTRAGRAALSDWRALDVRDRGACRAKRLLAHVVVVAAEQQFGLMWPVCARWHDGDHYRSGRAAAGMVGPLHGAPVDAGITLRRRHRNDTGWHLKLPAGADTGTRYACPLAGYTRQACRRRSPGAAGQAGGNASRQGR